MGLPWVLPHGQSDGVGGASGGGVGGQNWQLGDVHTVGMFVYNGATFDRKRGASIFKPQNATNTNAEITVWTPAAGKKFRLMKLQISGSVTGNYIFKDNTGGTTIFTAALTASQAIWIDLDNGLLSATANNVLTCTGPGASTLSGTLCGTEE